jgi:hypothetical protein
MLRCAVLCSVCCCAVLCCAVLCCAVLCCAVLCCAVLCCAVLCCAVCRQALGKYAGFQLGQRKQLQEVYDELAKPTDKRSAGRLVVQTLESRCAG